MYKLMVVDDEQTICDGLKELINWGEYGVQLIGTSQDGMEAFCKAKEEDPDIILTDIMMPRMNGIELLKKVYEEKMDVRFIFMSAYGEFAYAREAMRYGVKHYLLKPFNEEQIIEAINELCGELVKRNVTHNFLPHKEYSEVTKNVLEIAEKELSNSELSLKWIAENFLFMNVDYISRKFSHDTGQKFTDYLRAIRMERARELLLSDKNTNIYIVAAETGFGNNPQYFSQIFKNMTGLSPTEYVKKLRFSE